MSTVQVFWNEYEAIVTDRFVSELFEMVCKDYQMMPKKLTVNVVGKNTIININTLHLEHTYPTDIITFNYNRGIRVQGELYLCWPFIVGSAREFGNTTKNEFIRVLSHGILHLVGEDDHTAAAISKMREREHYYLAKFYK